MKSFITCLLALFVLIADGFAQEKTPGARNSPLDARAILQKSADACLKIENIEYREEQFHLHDKDALPFLTADVRQARADFPALGFLPGKFSVRGLTGNGDEELSGFAFSYDGTSFRVLDPAEKVIQVVRSPTPYIAGQVLAGTGGAMVGIPQFTQDAPFKLFLDQADNFAHEGTVVIEGEECDVVSVTWTIQHPVLGAKTSTSRWYIARRDSLPRGNDTGDVQRKIKILKINDPAISPDYFIPIRDGYSEKLITGKEPKGKSLLALGTTAPEWTLLDPQGKPHSLNDYRGKLVILDFWGTWCVPCWKTMPGIQRLHEKFKGRDVAIFGISVNDKELDPAAFMQRKGYTYKVLLSGDQVADTYKAYTLPTLYIVGFGGEIVHAEYGYRENAEEEITKIIEAYLKTQKK